MEKKLNAFSVFKSFPSNLLFFVGVLSLFIALFSFLRLPLYQSYFASYYESAIYAEGFIDFSIIGPCLAIVFCTIIYIISLILAFLFRNFKIKSEIKNIKFFIKLISFFFIFCNCLFFNIYISLFFMFF